MPLHLSPRPVRALAARVAAFAYARRLRLSFCAAVLIPAGVGDLALLLGS